jgi:hypothetical protein
MIHGQDKRTMIRQLIPCWWMAMAHHKQWRVENSDAKKGRLDHQANLKVKK